MDKLWRSSLFLGFLVLFAPTVRAETRVLFSSQESVEEQLVHLIGESRTSIEVALFELRSPRLTRALEEANARGVHIRMVLDASHRQEDLHAGEVRWLGGKNPHGHGVMHEKFAVFDQICVVTGSYNWTPGAEHSNYENVILTDDAKAVKAYSDEFESLWYRAIAGAMPALSPYPRNGLSRRPYFSQRNRAKTIRIKAPKSVRKRKSKAQTIRS